MTPYKKIQRKCIIFTILRFVVPVILIVLCFVLTVLLDSTVGFLLVLALAISAVSLYIFLTNRVKGNQLLLEDLVFSESLKGIYDKRKTANIRSYLNVTELVKNDILINPYRKSGFLYFEVIYKRITIDSSNLTLEYLEDSTKKRKKTYYGFVGRSIRYELRSHRPLYLVNKNSKFFNVGFPIAETDTFLVSGNAHNYDRMVNKGILTKLEEYMKDNDLNLSVFYLPEAIYILIENKVLTINPKMTQNISDEYLANVKKELTIPRDIADILQLSK